MTKKEYRKCGKRSKNGKRWIVELPLKWVEELELKGAMLELIKNDDSTITIKKIGTQQHKQESDFLKYDDEPLI